MRRVAVRRPDMYPGFDAVLGLGGVDFLVLAPVRVGDRPTLRRQSLSVVLDDLKVGLLGNAGSNRIVLPADGAGFRDRFGRVVLDHTEFFGGEGAGLRWVTGDEI